MIFNDIHDFFFFFFFFACHPGPNFEFQIRETCNQFGVALRPPASKKGAGWSIEASDICMHNTGYTEVHSGLGAGLASSPVPIIFSTQKWRNLKN